MMDLYKQMVFTCTCTHSCYVYVCMFKLFLQSRTEFESRHKSSKPSSSHRSRKITFSQVKHGNEGVFLLYFFSAYCFGKSLFLFKLVLASQRITYIFYLENINNVGESSFLMQMKMFLSILCHELDHRLGQGVSHVYMM